MRKYRGSRFAFCACAPVVEHLEKRALLSAANPVLFGTSGSYNNQGNTIAKAVDGNLSNYFDAPTASGAFVALDYGAPQQFSQISYAPRVGFANRMIGGLFQGSNSANFTDATTLYKVTTAPPSGVFTTVNITNTTAFRYVRYLGPTNGDCNIAEMKFYLAPTANSVVVTSDGTLTVTGTSQADTIKVNFFDDFEQPENTGTFTVDLNGITTVIDASVVKGLVVNGGDGNDNISIDGTAQNDFGGSLVPSTTVNVAVTEGSGNNTVNIYLLDYGFTSEGGVGPSSTVTAGDGNNYVLVYGTYEATVTVGNGNNTLGAGASDGSLSASFYAGNGDNSIGGASAGEGSLGIDAYVGTGQNTFGNTGQDFYISVYAKTSDGQSPFAVQGQFDVTGRVSMGITGKAEPGVTVFDDANNNGVVDATEQSTTTDANGDYSLALTGLDDLEYPLPTLNVRVIAVGFTTSLAVLTEPAENGGGISGQDFVLKSLASAAHPTLFGTGGSFKNDGNTIANAVDGNLSTFFDAPTASGAFVALDYGSPQKFSQISYAPRSGYAYRMIGGLFQGSNSADFSNATTLYKVTTAPTTGVLTTVNIPNSNLFEYVRYLGPINGDCNIAEMNFYPTPTSNSVVVTSDGTLTITGTAQADTIGVGFDIDLEQGVQTGSYDVTLNGVTTNINAAAVKQILINGGDGDDNVNVMAYEDFDNDSVPTADWVSTVVNEGNGNDTVYLYINPGLRNHSINPINDYPRATINAGDGNDTVSIHQIPSVVVNLGNGNDSVTGSAGSVGETDIVNAGNGNDTIYGQSAGDTGLGMITRLGTGHDDYYDNNDIDISVSGATSIGEPVSANWDVDTISGRATLAGTGTPVANATIFIDANNNGILDPGEQSTTTNSNGVYYLEILDAVFGSGFVPYPVRIVAPGLTAAQPVIQETLDNDGESRTGDDFVLTAPLKLTGQVIGTSGSYQNQGNTIAKAFDGILTNYFDGPDATGDWVGLDFGLAKVVTQVQFAPRVGFESRMVGGEIQASNSANFSNGVVTLATIASKPTDGVLTKLSLNNSTAYRYYRYIGPADGNCNLAELEFDG